MDRNTQKSIFKLGITGAVVLGASVFSCGSWTLPAIGGMVIAENISDGLLNTAAGILGGIAANAGDNLLPSGGDFVDLANNALTKSVGEAIASVIATFAKNPENKDDKNKLELIAKVAKDHWLDIAKEHINNNTYPEALREINLKELVTPTENSFTPENALDIDTWVSIVNLLKQKATTRNQFLLNPAIIGEVAKQLHEGFPSALREVLKKDFKADGQAFAALTIQLLTGMDKKLEGLGGDTREIIAFLAQLQQWLEQNQAQQQRLFSEIADKIDSGFAEFCQRLDVMDSNITTILQGLDEIKDDVKEIKDDVKEIKDDAKYTREKIEEFLRTNPRSLTPEQWRDVCDFLLQERQQKTTTDFLASVGGFTPDLDRIYVPLALVERTKEKGKPQPESEKINPESASHLYRETEKITPVTQDEFFNSLRTGNTKSKGRRITIIGEPGAGKTTRLQKIARWIFEENLGLPIWIDLRGLGTNSISKYLENGWLSPAKLNENLFHNLEEQFSQQTVWLLLDGLDEMTATAHSKHLLELTGFVSQARVILTCRTNVWDGGMNAFYGDFDIYRNQDFTPDQVTNFINNWFKDAKRPDVQDFLLTKLRDNQRLSDQVRNPLRLTMFCANGLGYHNNGVLPETQAQLYQDFVKLFYEVNNTKHQHLTTNDDQEKKLNQILAQLSLWAMSCSSSRFLIRPGELPPDLKAKLGGEDVQHWLAVRLGWLNCVGMDPENPSREIYAFYHATFQEYFAALGVKSGWFFFDPPLPPLQRGETANTDPPLPPLQRGGNANTPLIKGGRGDLPIFDKEWKQIILLWLGREDVQDGEKEEFIKALIEFDDGCGEWSYTEVDRGFYEYRAYFLAAAGISEFKKCSKSEEIVKQIVRWRFDDFKQIKWVFPDGRITIWGIDGDNISEGAQDVLSETQRERAIKGLVRIIDTTDESTRRQAAEFLGEIGVGNDKAIECLVRVIDNTTNEYTRMWAAEFLGEIGMGNDKAIEGLVRVIDNTTNEYTLMWAAESLGKIDVGNEKAIDCLVRVIDNTTDDNTRWQAAEFLGKIDVGNEKAINCLVRVIDNTTDDNTRWQAAEFLGKIDVGNEKAINCLVRVIDNTTDESTRIQAAECLGKIDVGNENAIDCLVRIIDNTTDESTRIQAAECLGKIDAGNEKAIDCLVRVIDNTTDESTRIQAAECLGKIDEGNEKAIDCLVRVIDNTTDESTRIQAAECLGKIDAGKEKAINCLVRIIDNTTDESTRRRAAVSLGEIGVGNDKAIECLVRVIDNTTDESTRRWAAECLGEIGVGNDKAIDCLVRVIDNTTDDNTRWQAAQFLEKILTEKPHYEYVVTQLKRHLNNETYKNKHYLFQTYYRILWRCAQNLPYYGFYQLWNDRAHPAAMRLSERLANLKTNPDLSQYQLILIDGSKFVDPVNPAAKIHTEMVRQGCTKSDSKIKDMTDFQAYWDEICLNKPVPVLIIYDTRPQGFNDEFVNVLHCFDGKICLISENRCDEKVGVPFDYAPFDYAQGTPRRTIKIFDPRHPNLIKEMIAWINN